MKNITNFIGEAKRTQYSKAEYDPKNIKYIETVCIDTRIESFPYKSFSEIKSSLNISSSNDELIEQIKNLKPGECIFNNMTERSWKLISCIK